jgi:DNA-binding NtrC family response regulator
MIDLALNQFDPHQYHVLVCLNETKLRDWLTGCLRHNHFRAESCESWKALKKALNQNNATLVVSDYGFDGFPAMTIGVL